MKTEWVNPHKEFLKDVVGVVEATNTEKFFLWKDYHSDQGRLAWVNSNSSTMIQLGKIDNMPVMMSMCIDVVAGHRVMFVECTSQVTDWRMVDEFLKKHLPQSAFNDRGYINKVDAMNFWNVLPTRPEPNISRCTRPPDGWSCSRAVGHVGPCAASKLPAPWAAYQTPKTGGWCPNNEVD